MRIAHISDLHFAKVSLSPTQFLSKRWLGNLNLIFCRQGRFELSRLATLQKLFTSQKVDLVVIRGDLSTTSRRTEFRRAAEFVQELQKAGIEVIALPGNHDRYTKRSCKKQLFYRYFDREDFSLKEHRLATKDLMNGWTLIALDTALATNLISSGGYFSPELEERLNYTLSSLGPNKNVLLVNHFPFFHSDGPRKALERGEALERLLKHYPNVKLYLHGHTHRHTIADLRGSSLPLVLDSGSAALRTQGSWNLIDLKEKSCEISPFFWKGDAGWTSAETRRFQL